jgi:hypothetical protein
VFGWWLESPSVGSCCLVFVRSFFDLDRESEQRGPALQRSQENPRSFQRAATSLRLMGRVHLWCQGRARRSRVD